MPFKSCRRFFKHPRSSVKQKLIVGHCRRLVAGSLVLVSANIFVLNFNVLLMFVVRMSVFSFYFPYKHRHVLAKGTWILFVVPISQGTQWSKARRKQKRMTCATSINWHTCNSGRTQFGAWWVLARQNFVFTCVISKKMKLVAPSNLLNFSSNRIAGKIASFVVIDPKLLNPAFIVAVSVCHTVGGVSGNLDQSFRRRKLCASLIR